MSEPLPTPLVERARAAAAQGAWQPAYDLLREADAGTPLQGPDLALLAEVAYATGQLDVTIDAWERAHAQSLAAGDELAAAGAAVRVALHLLFDTALMAPVRGWIMRAERLLEGQAATPVHAWLAVVRNYERLLSGDIEGAQHWARQAIDIGSMCDPAAAAMGRVAEARGLILAGDVAHGLALLNEAAVATVSGELDPLSTGVVYCELVCALQALTQYDLAEEWTAAMERWHPGQPVGSVHGRCRVHRAELLRLRGFYEEAETEVLVACEELRPYLRRELGWPLTELGRIRLRQGNLPGAQEAFLAAHQVGWEPQPGLALVRLAQGDVELAATSIRQALDHPLNVPSKEFPPNTDLRRAPLLEAQVEVEVAAGNLDQARAAAAELSRIAVVFASKALAASAALARGTVRLADRDPTAAQQDFAVAAQLWNEVGAPYETARARLGLAQAHRAAGDEARALLEFYAARAGFEQVGAVDQAAASDRAASEADPARRRAPERLALARTLSGGGFIDAQVFRRDGDSWVVAFAGQTAHLRDLKGLHYLACLLADPGRDCHVLELVAAERGWSGETGRGTEPGLAVSSGLVADVVLDAEAKAAYRRRLAEIEEDLEEAHALADDERAAQAEAERDFLVHELARAVGLGGRERRLGSASERARASVTRAIRQALTRIHTAHPPLGEHLDRTIRTGTYCAYLPDPRVPPAWTL